MSDFQFLKETESPPSHLRQGIKTYPLGSG